MYICVVNDDLHGFLYACCFDDLLLIKTSIFHASQTSRIIMDAMPFASLVFSSHKCEETLDHIFCASLRLAGRSQTENTSA